jgi:hypothetical protein
MANWITHVKNYAKKNGIKYGDALSDPNCSKEYKMKNKKGGEQQQGQEQQQQQEQQQEEKQGGQEQQQGQQEEKQGGQEQQEEKQEQQGGRRKFTNKNLKKRFVKGFNKSVKKLRSTMRMKKSKSCSKKNWFW